MATTQQQTQATSATLAQAMAKLQTIRTELNGRFVEASDRIDLVLAHLVARQHCLMLGPAGEAKSAITDAVMARVEGADVFKAQLFKTTTPDELFGMWDMPQLKAGRYHRLTDGLAPDAHLLFLDEVFKANSTLLNAFLMLMNERQFRNGHELVEAPLHTVVGASNEGPQGDDLGALWDRFLGRVWIQPLTGAGRRQFLADEMRRRQAKAATAADTSGRSGTTLSLAELELLQRECLRISGDMPDSVLDAYWRIEAALEAAGVQAPSTRRLGWLWDVVAASALLNGRTTATDDDLLVLQHCLWQEKQQISAVATLVMQVASPLVAKARDVYDRAVGDVDAAIVEVRRLQERITAKQTGKPQPQAQAQASAQGMGRQGTQQGTGSQAAIDDPEIALTAKLTESRRKLSAAEKTLMGYYHQAVGEGRSTADIQRMGRDIRAKAEALTALAYESEPVADWG